MPQNNYYSNLKYAEELNPKPTQNQYKEYNDPNYRRPKKKSKKALKISAAAASITAVGGGIVGNINLNLKAQFNSINVGQAYFNGEIRVQNVEKDNTVYLHYDDNLSGEDIVIDVLKLDHDDKYYYFAIELNIENPTAIDYTKTYTASFILEGTKGMDIKSKYDERNIKFTVEVPVS